VDGAYCNVSFVVMGTATTFPVPYKKTKLQTGEHLIIAEKKMEGSKMIPSHLYTRYGISFGKFSLRKTLHAIREKERPWNFLKDCLL